MSHEVIVKKLEQIKETLAELAALLERPFSAFEKDRTVVRAAERDFELIVEFASEINTAILIKRTGKTPDTYKQSFSGLEKVGVLKGAFVSELVRSAQLRNVLVHEYDLEEDFKMFYDSAKRMIPSYHEYLKAVYRYAEGKKN